jgi:hypothetical protein
MSKDELARRKEELEKIAAGKGAVSQTVHEWSFEGAQVSFLPVTKSLPLCRRGRSCVVSRVFGMGVDSRSLGPRLIPIKPITNHQSPITKCTSPRALHDMFRDMFVF